MTGTGTWTGTGIMVKNRPCSRVVYCGVVGENTVGQGMDC